MTRLATAWLVYRLTHSALMLGIVSFAGQIAAFLLGPFAGVWVERLTAANSWSGRKPSAPSNPSLSPRSRSRTSSLSAKSSPSSRCKA